MRLLTFLHRGRKSIGAELDSSQVVDFNAASRLLPASMRGFLEMAQEGFEIARRILQQPPKGALLPKRDLHICPPLCPEERPKIFCIGQNYAEHAAETGSKLSEEPVVFAKLPTSLSGGQHRLSSKCFFFGL